MDTTIYLDHAAATPLDPRVLAAMQPFFADKFHNPSALYLAAKDVAKDVEAARDQAARLLGAKNAEIVFTAGGTEANNLAIHGILRQFPDSNIVVSAVEHESVLEPARQYACREAGVSPNGRIDTDKLKELIDDKTVLVSTMYANNEIGTIQPISQIAKLVDEVRRKRRSDGNQLPLFLHTDAAQAANYLDLHISRLGVDLLAINGGKIYGPKQSGALYIRAGVDLSPQILGGGQERGYRSGTENVPGIIGFAKALELAQSSRQPEGSRLQELQKLFFELLQKKMPDVRINGSLKHRLPNNMHVTIPGQDNERLIMALDEAGIQASAGSACSADSGEPSHVLKATGLTDAEARSSLRFTMGRATDEAAVRKTVEELAALI